MKHRKKLRRGAILALVVVLLFNVIPAQASTTEISVGSYEELMVAIEQAENMDTITITSFLVVPMGSTLGDSFKQVIIKFTGSGMLEFEQDNSYSTTSTVINLIIDGDGKSSLAPLLRARGKIDFSNCIFKRANYGAVYAGYADITFTDCTFSSNEGTYGGHFNAGYNTTATFDNCSFSYGTTDTRGGGLYIGDNANVTLRNCIITANESIYGGGIYNASSITLESTLLYNNHASTGGDDLCTSSTVYDLGTLEDMEQEFKERNITIKPLSWEKSVNEYDGWEYYKLLYTSSVTDAEDTGGDTGDDDTSGEDQDPTTPSEGEDTGDESTDTEDPSTPPSEDNTDEGDTGSTDTGYGDTENKEPTEPSTPSDEETGGNTDNSTTDNSTTDNSQTDNSVTDNSTTDNSTTDNSVTDNSTTDSSTTDNSTTDNSTTDNSTVDNSVTDNSTHTEDNSGSGNTTDNSTHSSTTTDNSSHTQNTDSSTHSTTDNSSYSENHSSSTVNNYYQQEATGGSQNGSQPINIEVPVNITMPEQKGADTGITEAPEQAITVPQDIKIEAEGVDLVYEYTENGVSISIKATKEPENNTPAVTPLSTPVMATEAVESPKGSPNWVEVVTMLLLMILVLEELRDKIKVHREG